MMRAKALPFIFVALTLIASASPAQLQSGQATVIYTFPLNLYPESLFEANDKNFYGTYYNPSIVTENLFRLTHAGDYQPLLDTFEDYVAAEGFAGNAPFAYANGYSAGDNQCGPYPCGSIVAISAAGQFSTIYHFCPQGGTYCSDGSLPYGPLTRDNEGNYYGTTYQGAFELSAAGKVTPIITFCTDQTNETCSYGPDTSPPLLMSDGSIYLTYNQYGADALPADGGTIALYKIDSSRKVLTTVLTPHRGTTNDPLVVASDGNVYGSLYVNPYDGPPGQDGLNGAVFQNGNENFYVFPGGDDGTAPSLLTIGGDGNIYGVSSSPSQLFRLTPSGEFSVVAGAVANATALMQASDGNFYVAGGGYIDNAGNYSASIVRIVPDTPVPPPVQVSLVPSVVAPGGKTELTWKVNNGFSGSLQQCYGTVPYGNLAGAGSWVGPHSGSLIDGAYQNHVTVTPTVAGTYTYALTCGGVESGSASLQVGYATATALSVTPETVTPPGTATLTATVTSENGVPSSGNVTFSADGVTLGTAALSAKGVASITASSSGVAAGSYPVVATYAGSPEYIGSASGAVAVTVK